MKHLQNMVSKCLWNQHDSKGITILGVQDFEYRSAGEPAGVENCE